jgi:hypothetical protein
VQFAEDADILEVVARVLEEVVAPELPSGPARGQLRAAVGLLDNLAARWADDAAPARELRGLWDLLGQSREGGAPVVDVPPELRAARAALVARLSAKGGPAPDAEWRERCQAWLRRLADDDARRQRPLRYYASLDGR